MATSTELEDVHEPEGAADDEQPGDVKSKTKGKIKFESAMQRSEAAIYLEALVEGLRHGQLQFRHGEESLSLSPAQQVAVEVKAWKKGDKERVAFELEWRSSGDASAPSLDG